MFLKQRVSLGQWLLIGIGFIGVICVIQPGLDGFKPAALSAVLGVMFLALRIRSLVRFLYRFPQSLCLFGHSFALFSAGIFTIPFFGKFGVITTGDIGLLAISALAGSGAYFCIVMATRGGDVAVVAPFRYTRLLFALETCRGILR